MPSAAVPKRFSIVDTTLREGEQSALVRFSPGDKLSIALALEEFGVDCIELTSPVVTPGVRRECQSISAAVKRSRVLAHIRCHQDDASCAIDTGVHGINLFIATSERLRSASSLGSLNNVITKALGVIEHIHRISPDTEVRLSFEDAFRTSSTDLLRFLREIHDQGILSRIGIADTLGTATPMDVHRMITHVRRQTALDIEFHGHDDTGCAVANSFMAIEAGATHINTSVMGLGERIGITPLAGLIARLRVTHPQLLKPYRLERLAPLHSLVAERLGLSVPPNHYIIGTSAFHHKAGVHAGAVSKDPGSYEPLTPETFGLNRHVDLTSRLTGWRGLLQRSIELGCSLSNGRLKSLARMIKRQADHRPMENRDIDRLIKEAAS